MKFHDKKTKKWIAIITVGIVIAMVVTMIVPALFV